MAGGAPMFVPRFSLLIVERRKFEREPKLQIVRLAFDDERTWVRGMLHNISADGACVSVTTRKVIAAEFTLVLPPNKRRRCRLMWQRGDKIGVQFVSG
jgi:hypothetical protein